jgi:DeoR/GlpR family transcriptional regulator of sugar metabolism
MLVQERHQAILAELRRRPRMSTDRLQQSIRVSRSTLRRDLLELEHLGELVRVRGEVVLPQYIKGEPSFDRRRARRVEAKRDIAVFAAGLIPPNSAVFIDAGTTCLEVGRQLLGRGDLRLFTTSIRLVSDSSRAEAIVVCLGGEYRPVSDAVVGAFSEAWLGRLRFDVALIAASGLDPAGLWTTELSEAAVKSGAIARARTTVLVADSEKWGMPSAVRFAGWESVGTWVCDRALPTGARRSIGPARLLLAGGVSSRRKLLSGERP